jgi:DNA-binding transcriptional LysR family regulator
MVLASSVIPNAISDFLMKRPKVVIRIRDTPVDSLVDRLLSGDVDLAVGPDRACTTNVTSTPAFNSPWVLWCSPSHPLARKKTLNWNDLHGVSLVAAGRDHEQSVAQMHLNAPEGSRIRPVEVVDNITTALGLAAQGLAATLAPAYVGVVASSLGLVSRRVLDPETIRKVCVYKSTARAVNPAAEALAEFLIDWLDEWNKQMRTAKPRPVVRSMK